MLAHVGGVPIEETVLQLVPAGAAAVTAVLIAGRATLGRLRGRRQRGDVGAGVDNRSKATARTHC